MPEATTMPERTAGAGLLELLAWFSPAMPVGAYSYSHGLEYAVEAGFVGDAPALHAYAESALRHGAGRLDATFLAAAHGASMAGTGGPLDQVVALAAAQRGTHELALESAGQGRALLSTLQQAWPAPELQELDALCRRLALEPPYSCVAGVAAAAHHLALEATLLALLHAFAANLVSAGLRLIPLGQTDGQRITAALAATIEQVAHEAAAASLDDLGTATPIIDWCSMRHETQYTRLFRS
jgi:urease accessory protein